MFGNFPGLSQVVASCVAIMVAAVMIASASNVPPLA